jgi:DNA-binding XRE family transcriptional regulator
MGESVDLVAQQRAVVQRLALAVGEHAARMRNSLLEKPATSENHNLPPPSRADLARLRIFISTVAHDESHLSHDGTQVLVADAADRGDAPPVTSSAASLESDAVTSGELWLGDPDATHIERRRVRLGLSVQGLAALAGVSRRTISGIESRRHVPSARTLVLIARALSCHVEEIIEADWSR